MAHKPPIAVTNAVSWRSEGIKHRKNEIFLDVSPGQSLPTRATSRHLSEATLPPRVDHPVALIAPTTPHLSPPPPPPPSPHRVAPPCRPTPFAPPSRPAPSPHPLAPPPRTVGGKTEPALTPTPTLTTGGGEAEPARLEQRHRAQFRDCGRSQNEGGSQRRALSCGASAGPGPSPVDRPFWTTPTGHRPRAPRNARPWDPSLFAIAPVSRSGG